MAKVSIVTTSIGDEKVFEKFFSAYSKVDTTGHKVDLITIGDLNSPKVDFRKIQSYDRLQEQGISFDFVDVARQKKEIMDKFKFSEDLLPWKRIQRRNLGYLLAYQKGSDYIIAVDDDNFPISPDFLRQHVYNLEKKIGFKVVGVEGEGIKWLNPCFDLPGHIVHRGMPLDQRYSKPKIMTYYQTSPGKSIAVSAGFWEGDPDIDAISRVEGNPQNTKIQEITIDPFCIAQDTMAPFNSQNTAFKRELIPALFLSAKNGRYDDIWASYFARALMEMTPDMVSYGLPIVRQDRNDHNLLKDLENENYGMKYTNEFVNELLDYTRRNANKIKQEGDYLKMTSKVASDLVVQSPKFSFYYLDLMRWVDVLEKIS